MATVSENAPVLIPGDRLSRDEFLRRWEAMPGLKRAELIGGVVYMPSPLSIDHGDSDLTLGGWLMVYAASTPGCRASSNATWLMLSDAPQPDDSLRILPEFGGQSRVKGRYAEGAPELGVEVCLSSADYDLFEKLELYRAAGMQEYLAVLLREREVRWHRLIAGAYELLPASPDGIIRSLVFPGLWLNVPALLANDSSSILATLQQGLASPDHAAFVERLARQRKA